MFINASRSQLLEIITNAIDESLSTGHTVDEVGMHELLQMIHNDDNIDCPVFQGRSVELYINCVRRGIYEVITKHLDSEKQTWAATYPTLRELVGTVIREDKLYG
jgi:hypothetical protein